MPFRLLFPLLTAFSIAAGQAVPEHKMQMLRREGRDPAARDKVEDFQMAAEYWAHSKNLKNIPDMDAALAQVLPYALKQSPEIKDFHSWEKAHEYKSYHDAGAVLLAKCYTLLYYGQVKQAKEGLDLIDTKLRFSMLLWRNRGSIWVRKQMHYHEHFCAMYAMLAQKKFDQYEFPPERDEFDCDAMYRSMADMVRLRIQDGNIPMLEHIVQSIDKSGLSLPGGQRATFTALAAVTPQSWEHEHEASWQEMRDGITRWRKAAPSSTFARLAEARFYIEYAKHAYQRSDDPPTDERSAYQIRIGKAKEILDSCSRDTAEWYVSMLEYYRAQGAAFDDIAKTFQEGAKKFPGYVHIPVALCRILDRNKEAGATLSVAVIKELAASEHPENAAYCLRWLVTQGDSERLIPRLDEGLASQVLRRGIEVMPHSLKLRNDYGLVAVLLGQRDTARWCLRGLKDRWDRETWKDREDIVINLATDEPLHGSREEVKTTSL